MGRDKSPVIVDVDDDKLGKKGREREDQDGREWTYVMLFGLDFRSLALMRICLSVIIILDLYVRALYMHDHYSRWAAVPPAEVMARPQSFSLHYINTSSPFLFFLFALNALAALSLMVGYKCRLSNFICWVFLVSLHNRNPLVLNAGDDVFRLFIFWCMFLPTGKCASVDSMHNIKSSNFESKYYFSFGTIATLGQFCLIYWFTAALKTGPEWNIDYTATYYALHLDQFATRWAIMLREYFTLLKLLTVGVIYWEKYGPLLFFIPFKAVHGPLRTLAVLGFLALHFGFGTCLELGFFMCITKNIYYDSSNPIAHKALLLYRTFFLLQETPIIPTDQYDEPIAANNNNNNNNNNYNHNYAYNNNKLNNHTDNGFTTIPISSHSMADLHNHNFWYSVVDTKTMHIEYGYGALLYLISISPVLSIFIPVLQFKLFRNSYNFIASVFGQHLLDIFNRYTPNKPYEEFHKFIRWAISVMALLFFIYIVNWNFAGMFKYSVPNSVRWIGPTLKLDQYWGMFAPHPPKRDGWIIMPAELKDGSQIDIFTGQPVTREKPEIVSAMYPTQRWRKYLMNLQRDSNKDKRLSYGRYMCREWNFWDRHPPEKKLVKYKIIMMIEMTPEPGEKPIEFSELVLWEHDC